MKFIADLHIHSKFSRATAKNLDLENLYISARQKGITVVATGDFTHPEWFSELKDKLEPAEDGLFKLKREISDKCDNDVPDSCATTVRFMLVSEISCIYKKNSKTRKNHNLVFVPDFNTAAAFNAKLDAIGNIKSDGRPILGLDTKHLLEILLETSEHAFLVPAHIWTPWFSLFGSKSGFDSIEECFEDLSPYIFAVETGLSSDPPMNWRVTDLDNVSLISNSDAHSPGKIGREANIFSTELSYTSIRNALMSHDPEKFLGTFEFYPEEGKYHLDGHRKCQVCLLPGKTMQLNGLCPVCNKPLTLGVLNRVEALADRHEDAFPEKKSPYYSIVPLMEILAEILRVGPNSKKVVQAYASAIKKMGPEFDILHRLSPEHIEKNGFPLLGEAIGRMRNKKISVSPGYDGEFGKVQIFTDNEREQLLGQKSLFIISDNTVAEQKAIRPQYKTPPTKGKANNRLTTASKSKHRKKISSFCDLNAYQQRAVTHAGSPLLIVAGPGTGKTLTLTHRIAYLIKQKNISPDSVLAVTFTNKAAQEMKNRLEHLLGDSSSYPLATTFHSLCLLILKDLSKNSQNDFILIDEKDRTALVSEAIKLVSLKKGPVHETAKTLLDLIIAAKLNILTPHDNLSSLAVKTDRDLSLFSEIYRIYQELLSLQNLCDYEDLILNVVKLLEKEGIRKTYRERFKYIFIDEYQDLNHGQYLIVKHLAPTDSEICVIGDPDQSIYGFRGSDVGYFKHFLNDYPTAEVVHLAQSYRSTETILEASHHIIKNQTVNITGTRLYSEINGTKQIRILELDTEKSEAVVIGKIIEQMIGGIGYHSVDFGKIDASGTAGDFSFSDFAVLYRTGAQAKIFTETFDSAGIPYQTVSRESLYGQKGLSELVSFIKVLGGCGSFADLERLIRIPGSGVGNKTFEALKVWCYENRFSVNSLLAAGTVKIEGINSARINSIDRFLNNTISLKNRIEGLNIENRLLYLLETCGHIKSAISSNLKTKEAFNRLTRIAGKYKDSLSDFIKMIALQSDTDAYDHKYEAVSLMTLHASKGLEFPVVFIAGCENGYIPLMRSKNERFDIEEERRLFYVAMTRAKDYLFLTHTQKRMLYGILNSREISPFVLDIETHLRQHESPSKRKIRSRSKNETQLQLKLF